MAAVGKHFMKAIRVSKFGGPEVLQLCSEVPIPVPKNYEVLIKVIAAGVNPVDTYIRQGTFPIQPQLPYTPGNDSAGVVECVGSNVSQFKPGDRVFTCFKTVFGSYSEYCVAESKYVFPLSNKLTFSQGACLGVPYFTAYRSLFVKTNIKESDFVLIHGASGGVGLAALQLAKASKCVVIGTAGTKEGMQIVKENGADYVANHREEGYLKDVMNFTQDQGIDVVLEMLANVNLQNDLSLLKQNGTVVVIGSRGSVDVLPRSLMMKESSITGVMLGAATAEDFKSMGGNISDLVENGFIKPVISQEFPLNEIPMVHDLIINGKGATGNLVLKP